MNRYSLIDLQHAERDLPVPFELELPPDASNAPADRYGVTPTNPEQPWICREILRWLPGKRLVLEITRSHQRLLAKILFTHKDVNRELRGYERLVQHGIATAKLHAHLCVSSRIDVILYQWLDAPTLEQLNDRSALGSHSPALLSTVGVVAHMHRAGLRQVDIHPGNFLFDGEQLWTVDSAAVSSHQQPLGAKRSRENLADLLAQFYPTQVTDLAAIWRRYQQRWPTPNWQFADLQGAIDKMRALRWRHYKRKLTRSCSEFECLRRRTRFTIWRRDHSSGGLAALLNHPDQAIATGEALKQGNTATVAKVLLEGKDVIVKRYNIKNWRHRLNRCWRPSRGWHSWHNAYFLRFNGIPTPLPIALIEERLGPLRGRAFLLSEHTRGEDLKFYLDTAPPAERQAMLESLGGIIGQYWQAGISHGDMKADNFIVTSSGLTVIDLDPMAYHCSHRALQRALARDIRRFLKNFPGQSGEVIARELQPHLPAALQSGCSVSPPTR